MAYYLKAFVGAVLFIGAVVAFNVAMLKLLETGTCASGNTPYAISRPCPEGTGTYILILVGSIFGGLFGAGVFAFRGDPPGKQRPLNSDGISWGMLAWGLFFGGSAVAVLIGSFTGDLPSDGKTGGVIVGIVFGLMGLPVLLFQLWGGVKGVFGRSEERPSARSAGQIFSAGTNAGGGRGDPLDRIAHLDELRRSGALTQAEFDAQKAKILAEG